MVDPSRPVRATLPRLPLRPRQQRRRTRHRWTPRAAVARRPRRCPRRRADHRDHPHLHLARPVAPELPGRSVVAELGNPRRPPHRTRTSHSSPTAVLVLRLCRARPRPATRRRRPLRPPRTPRCGDGAARLHRARAYRCLPRRLNLPRHHRAPPDRHPRRRRHHHPRPRRPCARPARRDTAPPRRHRPAPPRQPARRRSRHVRGRGRRRAGPAHHRHHTSTHRVGHMPVDHLTDGHPQIVVEFDNWDTAETTTAQDIHLSLTGPGGSSASTLGGASAATPLTTPTRTLSRTFRRCSTNSPPPAPSAAGTPAPTSPRPTPSAGPPGCSSPTNCSTTTAPPSSTPSGHHARTA